MADRAQPRRLKRVWVRGGVQAACFAAFVYLAAAARSGWPSPLPFDAFLRADPLVWLLSSAAGRGLAPYGWVALALAVATAALGRLFCGWVCPLGAASDGVRCLRGRRPGIALPRQVSQIRFWVLLALLAGATAGANLGGWSDPLVMSSRALHVARGAPHEPLGAAITWALLAAAVALASVAPRLWCRSVCPLGAALSLLAHVAPYRRRTAGSCTRCGACSAVCPMGNTPAHGSPASCIGCRRCQAACGEKAIVFGFTGRSPHPQGGERRGLSRRGLLASAGVGGAAGLLVRRALRRGPLRPPGALAEEEFVARCVGCGTCLAVCPTGGLLPLVRGDRPDAMFTPHLVPRVGACSPKCTACGDGCPTGAIGRSTPRDKSKIQIGLAIIDRARCLPWARGERCLICHDACPQEYGAIELRRTGTGVPQPHVRRERCTGCGLCEHDCPEFAIACQLVAARRAGRTCGDAAACAARQQSGWEDAPAF